MNKMVFYDKIRSNIKLKAYQMKFLILIFFISCGKNPNSTRCYTREEALNYCILTRIAETSESSYLANIYCSPRYSIESCYRLGGL